MASKTSSTPALFIVMLLLAIALPLFRSAALIDESLLARFALLAFGGLLMLALSWKKLKNAYLPLYPSLALGAFLLFQLLSLSQAVNLTEAYWTLARYLIGFGFLLLMLMIARSQILRTEHLIKAGLAFALASAIPALFQLLASLASGSFFDDIYQITGLYSHKNLLASALMLALPFSLQAWSKLSGWQSKLAMVLSVLMIVEIFVLRTRGVWLGIFAATFFTALLFVATKPAELRFPKKIFFALSGLAVVILGSLFLSPSIKAGFLNSSNVQKRLAFWDNSWQMISENPLLGVGAGNWKLIFPKYGLEGVDDSVMQGITHIQRPHNDFLWIWSEAGPFALLCFLLIFIFAFIQIRKGLRPDQEPSNKVNLFFGFFGLVAYLVFSFSDFPSERAPHLFMLSLLLALVFQNKSGSQNSAVKLLVPVILGLGLLFGLFLVSQRWKGESATHAVLEANRTQNARAIVPAVEEALNPYYNVDPYANPLHYYSSLGYAFSGQTDAALEACREARKNAPYNILVYNAYANTYARRREADKALAYLDTAITISPKYKQALLLKAELLLDQKRFDEALDALNMHDPESDDRRYLQALARALRGSLRTYPQHGRFRPMMEYLQQQPRLEQPMDYVRAYKAKRGVN